MSRSRVDALWELCSPFLKGGNSVLLSLSTGNSPLIIPEKGTSYHTSDIHQDTSDISRPLLFLTACHLPQLWREPGTNLLLGEQWQLLKEIPCTSCVLNPGPSAPVSSALNTRPQCLLRNRYIPLKERIQLFCQLNNVIATTILPNLSLTSVDSVAI